MKTFVVEKKYLLIPIKIGFEKSIIQISMQEDIIYEFSIPVESGGDVYRCDYYASVPMEPWIGKVVTIKGQFPPAFFKAVTFADDIARTSQSRPEIHFAANTGWINDPNGLLYDKGCYHLYFQHNPFDTKWDNMCWGHAVSRDLLHWKQLETVMYPDADGTIYSGCGLKNNRKLMGLPEDALIFIYTSAGTKSRWSKEGKFRQKSAYSLDDGAHVIKRDGFAIDYIAEESRDPKVYWHEESQGYYMVLYLEQNAFGIFRSQDLEHWEKTQDFTLDKGWECPGLQEIPVVNGGSRWVFMSADGFYYLGDFDGYRFETDGVRHDAYQTTLPYAAQTFSGTKEVIMISWLRTKNITKLYCGVMSLPKRLMLDYYQGELRLKQIPVDEYYQARTEVCHRRKKRFWMHQRRERPLEIQITSDGDMSFCGEIFGSGYSYDSVTGFLEVEKEKAFIGKNIHELAFFLDEEICEVISENGFYYAAFEIHVNTEKDEIRVDAVEEIDVTILEIAESESV